MAPNAERRPRRRGGAQEIAFADGDNPTVGHAALLELSDERDQWMKRLLDAERAAYGRGLAEGYKMGYEFGARIREGEWPAVIRPLQAPTINELEAKRWGPGGREHFADPRSADRPQLRLIRGGGAA
ncbi:MAG TPA: hypothetical protein VG164_04510 [Trebonia sp.]|nr:hypothetical protein [Trebonia sp.]